MQLRKKELLKDLVACPRTLSDFYFEASCNWSVRNVAKIRSELRKAMSDEKVGEYLENIIIKYNLSDKAEEMAFYNFIENAFRTEYDRDLINTINSMHNKHALIGWLAIARCFIDSNFPVAFGKPLTCTKIKSLYKSNDTDYYLYKYQKQEHLGYFHNLLVFHCRGLLNKISYANLEEEEKEKVKLIFEGASKNLVRRKDYSSRGIEIKCELINTFVKSFAGEKLTADAHELMSKSFMFECKGAIEYFQNKFGKENLGKKRVIALT